MKRSATGCSLFPLLKVLPRLFPIFTEQALMQSHFHCIARNFQCRLARILVRDRRGHAAYLHAGFLHAVDFVHEVVRVVIAAGDFERLFRVVADDEPGFGVHRVHEDTDRGINQEGSRWDGFRPGLGALSSFTYGL